MNFEINNFEANYSNSLNNLALEAFEEYRNEYSDWPAFSKMIGNLASFAEHAEIIVATQGNELVGAVIYVAPDRPKSDIFLDDWAILRMLVVAPKNRGLGIGKTLTQECVKRAVRDKASQIGLHTSPIMKVALPMYLRMGFIKQKNVADIYGVPYAVYAKNLSGTR